MSIRSTLVGSVKLAALAVVLVATLAHAAQYGHAPAAPSVSGDGMSVVRGAKPSFKISGHIKNLYPGKSTKLVTTVRNPNRVGIRVTLVKAKVTGVSGCPSKNIKVKPFKGKRFVGAGHTVKVKLAITMKLKAPNGCQGAKLRISYHGKAKHA